jgi:exodeoxyribonuclease V alpha subunit
MAHDDDDLGELSERPREHDAPLETREGTVKKVVWQAGGSPRKILKVAVIEAADPYKRRRQTVLQTWKGKVGIDVEVGSVIAVEGYVTRDNYGESFEVTRVLSHTPFSRDGMKMWLMKRLPDIGEVRALALADMFPGEQLFSVIKDHPEQLTAVNGITEARATAIQKAYLIYEHERIPVAELVSWGIDFQLASEAVETLKVMGLKRVLSEDAFELVDLPGWSFKMVKEFVSRQGNPYHMELRDPRLIRAYMREVMERLQDGDSKLRELMSGIMPGVEMSNNEKYKPVWNRDGGDCFIGREHAKSALAMFSKFGYSMQDLGAILKESKHLAIRDNALFLANIDEAERNVARVLRRKIGKDVKVEPVEFVAEPGRPTLDPSQREAAEALVFSPLAVMTGGPGTGKTTTLRSALRAMEERDQKVVLASPTGKAAQRMTESTGRPATTIHRLLEWTPTGFKRNETNPIEANVIVIDESSMLDIELASSLMSAVGNARLILVGDEDQLPPVGPGQVLTDIMKAKVGEEHAVPVYRLTKTHRQAGENWVIANASRIIQGMLPSLAPVTGPDGDFRFEEARSSNEIMEKVVRAYEIARQNGYEQQMQVLTPVRRAGMGANAHDINLAVQKRLNPRSTANTGYAQGGDGYRIFPGDKVIYTKNTPKLGLVNGNMGWVEEIDQDDANVQSMFALVRIDGLKNENREDGLFELRAEHFKHLWLAYAMSIHKSQGSEWPFVHVVMDNAHSRMLKRQLLYTAVTRTSRNLVIVGSRSAVEQAATGPRQNQRWTKLSERIAGEPV